MEPENKNGLNWYRRNHYASFGLVILVIFMFFFTLSSPALAAKWYVKIDGSDTYAGTSWETAFQTIQSAINAAAHLDEIWVKQGTYEPGSWILVNKKVKIYGGFTGSETMRDQRNWRNNLTTVDGRGVIDHCFYIDFAMDGVVIDGFTLAGGYADGPVESNPYRRHDSGGAIFIQQSEAIISNCIFLNNTATGDTFGGGALFISGMNAPMIFNCHFINNQALGGFTHGGAINSASSDPTIVNCVFEGNSAGGYGGAIVINGNTPVITNCTFTDNLAIQGGAIYSVNSGAPMITNSIFWGDAVFSNNLLDGPEIYDSADDPGDTNDSSLVVVNYCIVQDGGTTGQTYFADGNGNLAQDPLFVNSGAGDLRVPFNSPCVDQGDSAALPIDFSDLDGDGDTAEQTPIDIDGNRRMIDVVDIGAYEFRKIWHVNSSVSASGNGMSWPEAFQAIQEAILAAQDGHEISVREGDYLVDQPVSVNKGIALYGGFDGTELVRDQRDWVLHKTTVDGQGLVDHCLLINQHAIIDGFIITGGVADGLEPHNNGGGIYIGDLGADVYNCIVTGNSAVTSGGGIYNRGTGVIANTLLYGNTAANGGGIADENGALTIVNVTVSENIATNGGGLWNDNATSTLINTIIWGNSATTGAALFLGGNSVPVVNYSTIEGGSGETWFDSGAGNLDTEPLFVDGSNDDFHLQTVSPCIDAGDDAAVPPNMTVDFDGNARTSDGDEDGTATVDMGVDEYTHVPVIWYVDGTMVVAGDGTSWDEAFQTMEGAIDNPLLRSGDSIWVKSGRYVPPSNGWDDGHWFYINQGLYIDKTISVYGGFPADMANPQWIDRDWKSYETIIDANTQIWNQKQRCFFIRRYAFNFDDPNDVVIDGFTITGGRYSDGAGIFIEHSRAIISNCVIKANYAISDQPSEQKTGGGIKVNGYPGSVTVQNCVISGNSAEYGGAIAFTYVSSSAERHPRIINSTITGNRTTGMDGSVYPVAPTIFQSWQYDARLEITNTIIWNNATNPPGLEIGFLDTSIYGTYENNPGDVTVSYSDIHGGTEQSWFDELTDIDDDPRFAQLGHWEDNGTPADARDDYWISGDQRLQADSPCIDTGDNGSVPADLFDLDDDGDTDEPVPFDLAHEVRLSGPVNMGAYEITAAPSSDLDGDGDVDAEDLAILAPDFGATDCAGDTCAGDLDGDGDIDGTELAAFASAL